ncbi:MAG: hypothetical protein ACKV0T_20595 [Planctomycetales bacterium]
MMRLLGNDGLQRLEERSHGRHGARSGNAGMGNHFLLKIVVPLFIISLLLLGLGVVAAWNVHRQQVVNSLLIAQEVEGILAAQDVYIGMRGIRHQLNQYLRQHDRSYFERIPGLHQETAARLERAKSLARTDEERQLIRVVDQGYEQFWTRFQQISAEEFEGHRETAYGELVDKNLTNTI